MAIQSTYDAFNPKEQDVTPGSYLKLFDSVTQYQNESGLGTALKGMANILDKGIDAAKALYLNDKSNEIENRIEPIVEDYTKNLEDAQSYIKGKTRPIASQDYSTNLLPGPEGGSPAGTPIQAGEAPIDIVPESAKAEARADINKSADYIDSLKAGNAQGKISDVYFRAAVANEAKDIRNNTLVGFRPEIDQMISSKMHTVQANPYIESLLHDINTSLSAGKQEKNAMLGTLRSHAGVPGVDRIFDDLNSDRIGTTEAMYRLSVPLQQDYLIKQAKQQLELQGESLKVNTQLAEKNANAIASANALLFQSSHTTSAGVSSQDLDKLSIDLQSGARPPLNQNEAMYYASQAEATRQAIFNKTLSDLREVRTDPKTGQKYSYESLTSPDFVLNAANKVAQHWADQRDNFYKGDLSAATFQTRAMEAAKTDTQFQGMFDHPDAAAFISLAEMLKKNGVPDPVIQETLSQGGAYPKIAAMVAKAKYEIALPDELKGSLPPGMKVTSTFKGQVQRMSAIYEANGLRGDFAPQSITDFTKIIDGKNGVSLVNTNDPKVVDTIAHHVFGPGNENAFKYFNQNTYDEKGRLVPGAQTLFNRFSQKDVVNQINKYASDQVKREYYNFMTITAREDLLREDLPRLKEAVNSPNNVSQLAWDTGAKEFRVIPNPAVTGESYRGQRQALRNTQLNQAVENVNTVLNGLKSIAENSGKKDTDVDAFVLAPVMSTLGDISSVEGVPQSLATTIKNAYVKQRFDQESSALNNQGLGMKGSAAKKYTKPPKGE